MKDVFEYLDYREYLADYYEHQKQVNPKFSLRYFALKAGFPVSAASLFINICKARRGLSEDLVSKFSKGIGLKGKQRDYFETLVRFNQCKRLDDKNRYFEKLAGFRESKAMIIKEGQHELFSKWYYLAIRGVLDYFKFPASGGDFGLLGRQLRPSITTQQAEKAVLLLKKLGMIALDKEGYYVVCDPVLSTGDEVHSMQVANFQIEAMKMGLQTLDRFSAANRDVSTLTLTLSSEGFEKIKERIRGFRKELASIAGNDKKEDRVIQCNFQVFPFTKSGEE